MNIKAPVRSPAAASPPLQALPTPFPERTHTLSRRFPWHFSPRRRSHGSPRALPSPPSPCRRPGCCSRCKPALSRSGPRCSLRRGQPRGSPPRRAGAGAGSDGCRPDLPGSVHGERNPPASAAGTVRRARQGRAHARGW